MIESQSKKRSVNFLLQLLMWSILGFFFVMQQYIYSASNNNPFNWFDNLSYRLPTYLLWAIFTPFVYFVAERINFKKKFLVKNIFVLSLLGIAVSIIHRFTAILLTFYIRDLFGTLKKPIFEAVFEARFAIIGGGFDSLFTYMLILSVIFVMFYFNRLKDNEKFTSQLETKLAEAKLDSLKSQLHPHFLFNTLHAISTLMHKDIDLAERTLVKLSDLLRISLDHLDKQKIPLKDEIEFLLKYLEIQQIRFQDKLKIEVDIESNLYNFLVPSFLLQPIVENSIKYAIEPSSIIEDIKIRAEQAGDYIVLSVEDSGPGLNENFNEGIGIKNTRARLKQIYNDNFELSFTNKAKSGLVVKIKLQAES